MKVSIRGRIGAPAFFGDDTVLTSVLTAAGLTPERAAEIVAVTGDQVKDFKPDDYVNEIRSNLTTSLLNDNTFLSNLKPEALPESLKRSLEAGQYGKFMNEAKTLISKTMGIDLSDLTEKEATSIKAVLQKSFEKYGSKINSPEDLKKLQADLLKVSQEKEELETSSKTALETAIATERANMSKEIRKLVTQSELSTMNLKIKPSLVADTILNNLESKYTLVNNGTEIKIKQKENPGLDVIEGGKVLTFQQALKAAAVENELIGPEKKKEEQDEKIEVTVTGDKVGIPSYILNKIKDNIAKEAK